MREEDRLVTMLAQYLNAAHPKLIYHFDVGSGGTKTIGMAMRDKRINRWRGFPDLTIVKPSRQYHGFYLEIKKEGTKLFNKKMNYATPHLEEQGTLLEELRVLGYYAHFGIGFDDCVKQIKGYLEA